ncbi:hypothetical protein [Andreprevotia chitinilytica]|uniref:hypothetical protein n=1 Tax=Andreprevotia chitinilytica TaxID=396808 RepID=UPI00055757F2|nr:hypothetical protein [Andreprevotia chitinilytica]
MSDPLHAFPLTAKIFGVHMADTDPFQLDDAADLPNGFCSNGENIQHEYPVNTPAILDVLNNLPADFMAAGREDAPAQERESF